MPATCHSFKSRYSLIASAARKDRLLYRLSGEEGSAAPGALGQFLQSLFDPRINANADGCRRHGPQHKGCEKTCKSDLSLNPEFRLERKTIEGKRRSAQRYQDNARGIASAAKDAIVRKRRLRWTLCFSSCRKEARPPAALIATINRGHVNFC